MQVCSKDNTTVQIDFILYVDKASGILFFVVQEPASKTNLEDQSPQKHNL